MRRLRSPSFNSGFPILAISILAIIAIVIGIAFASYYYLQGVNENELRRSLFAEAEEQQVHSTKLLSDHVSSDISGMALRLRLLATEPAIQRGDFSSIDATTLLKEAYGDLQIIAPVSSLGIIDTQNMMVNNAVTEVLSGAKSIDLSDRDYVKGVKREMKPYLSEGFTGITGGWRVALAVPIVEKSSGDFLGIIVAGIPIITFLELYGNVYDFGSQSIVALDRNGVVIATFVSGAIGKPYFSDDVQELIGRSEARDNVFRNVMSGKPDSTIFTASLGERLITGYPVYQDGNQVMSIIITTPTSSIYAKVDEGMAISRLQISVMLFAVSLAVTALVILLLRWNRTLEIRVRAQTMELRRANERLTEHDKLQREFINIAAHELRTPVQPILGITELLGAYPPKAEGLDEEVRIQKSDLQMLGRNAARLERLSSDILEVSRIESRNLRLNTEKFDLSELIKEAAENARIQINTAQINVVTEAENPLVVTADRIRIMQVISNLLNNSLRFTAPEGTITLKAESQGGAVKVAVKDTGTGISEDDMPRLFSKFFTTMQSGSGTGLGLYIAKAIVDAHGGNIWAENNKDGKGATFTFIIPMTSAVSADIQQPRGGTLVNLAEMMPEMKESAPKNQGGFDRTHS